MRAQILAGILVLGAITVPGQAESSCSVRQKTGFVAKCWGVLAPALNGATCIDPNRAGTCSCADSRNSDTWPCAEAGCSDLSIKCPWRDQAMAGTIVLRGRQQDTLDGERLDAESQAIVDVTRTVMVLQSGTSSDSALRQQCQEDPGDAMKSLGISLPEGVTLRYDYTAESGTERMHIHGLGDEPVTYTFDAAGRLEF